MATGSVGVRKRFEKSEDAPANYHVMEGHYRRVPVNYQRDGGAVPWRGSAVEKSMT
jgi:hypothetical protein